MKNKTVELTVDSELVHRIANNIRKSGGRLYIVGGMVRDLLLDRENHDWDLAVRGITADVFEDVLEDSLNSMMHTRERSEILEK